MTTPGSALVVVPATRDEANALVEKWHRHHPRVEGHRFAIALDVGGELVGAAIVARPQARELAKQDPRFTAELVRLVVKEGVYNGCTKLMGAAWRSWRSMGGRRLVTYTLLTEPGSSLKAAGAVWTGTTKGGEWDRPSRRRKAAANNEPKNRWEWIA